MHDLVRNSIEYSVESRFKIIRYLTNNYEMLFSDDGIRRFMFFIGKNIQFLDLTSSYPFLPKNILDIIDKNHGLALSLGDGVAKNLSSLTEDVLKKVLEIARKNRDFAIGFFMESSSFSSLTKESAIYHILYMISRNKPVFFSFRQIVGYGFGQRFGSIKDRGIRQKIMRFADEDSDFQIGLSSGIGDNFRYLNAMKQESLLNILNEHKGIDTFSYFIGENFNYLHKETQMGLLEMAGKNNEFALGLARGLSFQYYLPYFDKEVTDDSIHKKILELRLEPEVGTKILKLAEEDNSFFNSLGSWLSYYFVSSSTTEVSVKILELAEMNESVRVIGSEIGWLLNFIDDAIKLEKIWQLVDRNKEFSAELGYSTGTKFDCCIKFKNQILELIEKNVQFARSYGAGYASNFLQFIDELDTTESNIPIFPSNNSDFVYGLGVGLGMEFPNVDYYNKEKIIMLVDKKNKLSNGIFHGLASGFGRLEIEVRDKIWGLAKRNMEYARSLGRGFGYRFPTSDRDIELREQIWIFASSDDDFADGLGEGLGSISTTSFQFVDYELQNEIWVESLNNEHVIRGLSRALGANFQYLRKPFLKSMWKMVAMNPFFAQSLGVYLKEIFSGLDERRQHDIMNAVVEIESLKKGMLL